MNYLYVNCRIYYLDRNYMMCVEKTVSYYSFCVCFTWDLFSRESIMIENTWIIAHGMSRSLHMECLDQKYV